VIDFDGEDFTWFCRNFFGVGAFEVEKLLSDEGYERFGENARDKLMLSIELVKSLASLDFVSCRRVSYFSSVL
jgi:hypothetical protein